MHREIKPVDLGLGIDAQGVMRRKFKSTPIPPV